ncbi:MAG TPA: type II secretion system protein E [Thermomicrobiaceae bacterium]|nr:type II secretion system protein E [Thermomicrobiaceae bacterium]
MAQRSPQARRHDEPFGWWGYRADLPTPLSMVELISRGSLDARTAAFLWLALEQRASLVVAARPPGAGKTTTLTALLDFLPPEVKPIYLRGWYERFDFLEESAPEQSYLLCNEISSHLPTYLWGRGVRRLFEAVRDGYGMATTVHAGGAAEVISVLEAYPLEVPHELVCGIDLVLTLGVGLGPSGLVHRLMALELITPGLARPLLETIAARDVLLGPLEAPAGRLIGVLVERFGLAPEQAIAELAGRERYLERLRDRGVLAVDAVRRAIGSWPPEPDGVD